MWRGVINPTLVYSMVPMFDKTVGDLGRLCDLMAEHLRVVLYKHLHAGPHREMFGKVNDVWVEMQQPAVIARALKEAPNGRIEWSIDFIWICVERVPDDPP